jgi:hypothetical protein
MSVSQITITVRMFRIRTSGLGLHFKDDKILSMKEKFWPNGRISSIFGKK